jgi:hypothetical protein
MAKVRSKLLSKYTTMFYFLVFIAVALGLYYLFRNNFRTRVGKEGLVKCTMNDSGRLVYTEGERNGDPVGDDECELNGKSNFSSDQLSSDQTSKATEFQGSYGDADCKDRGGIVRRKENGETTCSIGEKNSEAPVNTNNNNKTNTSKKKGK